MTAHELQTRLRRIEGLLGSVAKTLEEQRDEIDMDGRIARAYKAGYMVGRLGKDAGAALDPELALARRRGHYAVRGNRQRDRKAA
jgi:hypothetical protein